MTTLYIDFEGQDRKIVEAAAILDCGERGLHAFHHMMRPNVPLTRADEAKAHYSHCIPNWKISRSLGEDAIWRRLERVITEAQRPLTICGFGRDVSEVQLLSLMPHADFAGVVFEQVQLSDWVERDGCVYHHLAKELAQWFECCDAHTLSYRIHISQRGPALSQRQQMRNDAKIRHGSHCAFTDSLELLMVHQQRRICPLQMSSIQWM